MGSVMTGSSDKREDTEVIRRLAMEGSLAGILSAAVDENERIKVFIYQHKQ